MGFHDDAIFPSQIAVDSTFGWGFQTAILTSQSGSEQRVARREVPQHVGDVSTGILDPEQLLELKAFHLARRGALYGFRFKDPLDHLSTDDDPCAPDTVVSFTDQVIGTGDNEGTTSFQLTKTYSSDNYNYVRKITKPIEGTVVVGVVVGGTPTALSSPADYTVDHSTGTVLLSSAPDNGEDVVAGFEFHTPVRFEEDADRAIEVAFQEFKYGSIPRIGISEILDGGVASDEFWFGGSFLFESPGTDGNGSPVQVAVSATQGRYNRINFSSAGGVVALPNAGNVVTGGPHFYIHNVGSPCTILDPISGALVTPATGGLYQIYCYYNPGQMQNIWVAQLS
tara:strand:+ start:13159 stop:14175 length:1017 start_codon:yes stop_codon:yes gene_type:complete